MRLRHSGRYDCPTLLSRRRHVQPSRTNSRSADHVCAQWHGARIDWRFVGLAVVAHQVVRATKDVNFLVESEAADKVHAALLNLGYQCLYRSEDAANCVRAAEGLDLLYAHRPLARRLLAQASERETPMGRMRIISVEGLIGFKLKGFVNDAPRTRDLDDIRALLKIHRNSLNTKELCEYFALFEKPGLLNELLG
jgi:hypothetical protein